MARFVRREEPCTRCGADVVQVYEHPTRLGRTRLVQAAPDLVGVQHAEGDRPGDRVDDECVRGQYGPTADYGDG